MKRSTAVVVVLVVLLGPASPRPAAAHPFGPPPTAVVSADGRTVTVEWSATPDDAVAIGERLGLMPPGSVTAYREESVAQVAPSGRDEARLSASVALRDYLMQHIRVVQEGQRCTPRVPAIADFVHRGARVVLRCPDPVSEVTLRITMLHDIHDAYRTVAVGRGSSAEQSVFTIAAPEHRWRFGADASSVAPLGAVVGATGAAMAAILVATVVKTVHRRRRRGVE